MINATTLGGASGERAVQSGSCPRMAARQSVTVSPSNALRPVSISYSTQPNAQMSVRLSTGEPAGLLRAHVGGRPDNHPFLRRVDRRQLRQIAGRVLADGLGQSEIQHLDGAAVGRLDVGWLQIPMNDALRVRRLECFGCLARDRQRVVQRQRPLTNAIGERCPVDELEDERDDVFAFFERVDGGDVRMIQRRKDLRLALEASDPGGVVTPSAPEAL